LQEHLKKLPNKISKGKENGDQNGEKSHSGEKPQLIKNGDQNGKSHSGDKLQLIENGDQNGKSHSVDKPQLIENGDLCHRGSSEHLKEENKQADIVKKMSELVSRNPLYTALHRLER
jgi:hypothetical protein